MRAEYLRMHRLRRKPGAPQQAPPMKVEGPRTKVLAIGDTHMPFHHKGWMAWVVEVAARVQPDVIVQLGDAYDLYSWSRYPRTHNLMTPAEEHETGREAYLTFWADLHKAAPDASLMQLRGNHDARPLKRALESMPAGEEWIAKGLHDLFVAPHVTVVDESKEELEIDGVIYTHGYTTHGRHAPWLAQSTVHGHTHRGAVTFWQRERRTLFELDVGWGGDVASHAGTAFSYYSLKRAHGTNLGVGLIDSDGPRFIPMAW